MRFRKGKGPRLYQGEEVTDKYISEFLKSNPLIVKDLGISALDFEDCCNICTPKTVASSITKDTGFSFLRFSPIHVIKAAFYLVVHKCVYERKEFKYARGSVALYPFPSYYSEVVRNTFLKNYYSLDPTDPNIEFGFLQIRPNLPKPALEKLGYYKNPVKLIVEREVQQDISLLINSRADLADLPVITTKDIAKELHNRFPMYTLDLLVDYINQGFFTYTRLSLQGFPVNMPYYERGHKKEGYYKFQIRNFTNVYRALKFAFKKEPFVLACDHYDINLKRDYKCKKQRYINKVRANNELVKNASPKVMREWAALKTKNYIYESNIDKQELLDLYKCPVRNDYQYSREDINYWEIEEQRINIPV